LNVNCLATRGIGRLPTIIKRPLNLSWSFDKKSDWLANAYACKTVALSKTSRCGRPLMSADSTKRPGDFYSK